VQSWQIYISPLQAIIETSLPYGLPFNAIDGALGAKADLYIAKSTGLDVAALARRRRLPGIRNPAQRLGFFRRKTSFFTN